MQVTSYRALRSINVDDERATAVVDQLEAHVATKVDGHIRAVEAKLEAVQSQLRFQSALIVLAGVGVTVATLVAGFLK